MKSQHFSLLLVMFTLVLSCTKTPLEEDVQDTIVKKPEIVSIIGGNPVSTITQRPFQVGISANQSNGGAIGGGGAIISSEWIITAAHVVQQSYPGGITIYAGSATWGSGQVRTVDQIIIHNDYNNFLNFAKSDIALLHLSTPLNLDSTCAAIPYYNPIYNEDYFEHPYSSYWDWDRPGLNATVSGWGNTNSGSTFQLQSVGVTIISSDHYNVKTFWPKSDLVLYTNSNDGQTRGICDGDSGGPLTTSIPGYGEILIGIVNFGTSNCLNGASGYARVSKFADWIYNNTGIGVPIVNGEFNTFCGNQLDFNISGMPSGASVLWGYSENGVGGILTSWGHSASIQKLINSGGALIATVNHYGNMLHIEKNITFGIGGRSIQGLESVFVTEPISASVEIRPDDSYYRWYLNNQLVSEGGSGGTANIFLGYGISGQNFVRVEIETTCGQTEILESTIDLYSH